METKTKNGYEINVIDRRSIWLRKAGRCGKQNPDMYEIECRTVEWGNEAIWMPKPEFCWPAIVGKKLVN